MLQPNTTLQSGKYKIVRFLSNGGFGNTYEGVHTMMDTRIAIKEFFPKMFCNRDENTSHVTVATQGNRELVDKLRKKFNEEAKAVFQMNHPNIVRVLDIFEENGTAYYVMEYIDGKSLNEITKERGALPEAEAVGYIRQVADALKYVHSLNRLHLDIKPGNIMVDKNGKAILIDFGASKHYDLETGENTSTLMGVNTKGYAPIEQSTQSFTSFSPATDLYALGATLYKLLTGIVPPDANLLLAEEDTLQPLPNSISASTRNAVKAAMQLRRKDRPRNMDEFVAMLCNKQSVKNETIASIAMALHDYAEENVHNKACVKSGNNFVSDEETIIDSSNKPRAKSPKFQKSDQEIKDEAWDIAKKYPLGFREYSDEYERSLNDVNYCRKIVHDKSLIMRGNQRLSKNQDYNADAQKLYKKYGEVVRFEDCKKILMEEKGNFAIAEQRVAKWYENMKKNNSANNNWLESCLNFINNIFCTQSVEDFLKLIGAVRDTAIASEESINEETLANGEDTPKVVEPNDCSLEFDVDGIKFKMIKVEGGTFYMTENVSSGFMGLSTKVIVQKTTLSDYCIGETQVTQALWKAVMGDNPSHFKSDNLPVETVTWYDCQVFIKKLNEKTGKIFRLPTEAEWEFAARGGNKSKRFEFSGSSKLGYVAWYNENGGHKTHAVATKQPNELGIYDMIGNVWEWCADYRGNYSSTSQTNPTGPYIGSDRVCRGGSWGSDARFSRSSYRFNYDPDVRYDGLGFRLALSQ